MSQEEGLGGCPYLFLFVCICDRIPILYFEESQKLNSTTFFYGVSGDLRHAHRLIFGSLMSGLIFPEHTMLTLVKEGTLRYIISCLGKGINIIWILLNFRNEEQGSYWFKIELLYLLFFLSSCWSTRDHIGRSPGIPTQLWHLLQVVPSVVPTTGSVHPQPTLPNC